MSTNKTQNLNLHSWVKKDEFKMEEFNENFSAIDAAVGTNAEAAAALEAAKAELVMGSFTGDGALTRTVSLGFTPRAVFVTAAGGSAISGQGAFIGQGFALAGCPMYYNDATHAALAVVSGGFQVRQNTGAGTAMNLERQPYYYIAVK